MRKLTRKQLSYTLTEKIDGVAVDFGVDEKGFYTSRESKGGTRYYHEADYPRNQFWATPFRSAHKALKNIDLQSGVHINAEILFGHLPNTVPYNNNINQIAIFNADGIELETKVVLYDIPITTNGREITALKSKTYYWKIAKVPQIENSKLEDLIIKPAFIKSIESLNLFLQQQNEEISTLTNEELFNVKLNKKPEGFLDWKEMKEAIKLERDVITGRVMKFKLAIKEFFLDALVRNVDSKFGGDWIEGVVIQYDEEFIKIVDRDIFWRLNSANYEERNKVAGKGNNVKNTVRITMTYAAGLPKINKRYIESMGSTYSERLTNISDQIIFASTKKAWIGIIIEAGITELEAMLAVHNSTKPNQYINIKYNQYINERTLMVYAQTFNYLENLKLSIIKTTNSKELIESWLADKLDL